MSRRWRSRAPITRPRPSSRTQRLPPPRTGLSQWRLRAFLTAVSTRLPERVALASLDVATMAESRSYYEAATEFAHTALAAAAHANPGGEARACTSLARLARKSGRW